jgi:hypothetical protein
MASWTSTAAQRPATNPVKPPASRPGTANATNATAPATASIAPGRESPRAR